MSVHVGGRGPGHIARVMGSFSLDAFMASQSAGFWYNFLRNDTMFQEDVGPTPADEPNEVIGLALSQRLWGGQTRAGYLAGQPENRQSGSPVLTGTATAATYNTSTGAGTVTRVAFTNQSGVAISGLTGARVYAIDIDAPANMNIRDGVTATGAAIAATSAGRNTYYVMIGAAAAGLTITATAAGGTQSFTLHSVRLASQVPATQSTTSFKVKYQLVGATGDGTDDREVTNYAAGSGENFLMLPDTTVPVTLAGTQVMAGAMDGSANGAYVAITTNGLLRVKWGSTTLDSTGVDLRNGVHDLGFWTDNGTLYLFADGVVVGSGAWTGTIPTTTWNLWALNNNGTASNFFAGSLSAALAGREAINLARAIHICANA